MQDVFRAIGLSQSQVTVLITGESGSGKELVARALHKHSPVADGPFVAINTAAIPKDLLEANSSATSAAPSPVRRRSGAAALSRPRAARCSSMKSATCRLTCRRACCACCLTASSIGGRPRGRQGPCARDCRHPPEPGAARQEGGFREDLFHRLNVIPAPARAARAARGRCPCSRATSCSKARGSWAWSQAHCRLGAGAAGAVCLPGQRAPAGEHLPLADRDGARQVISLQDLAARGAGGPGVPAAGARYGGCRACGSDGDIHAGGPRWRLSPRWCSQRPSWWGLSPAAPVSVLCRVCTCSRCVLVRRRCGSPVAAVGLGTGAGNGSAKTARGRPARGVGRAHAAL